MGPLRALAVIIVLPTLAMLWINGERDGVETLYFLLPDIFVSLALLAAAIHGGRKVLLAAYALAAGVFMTATFGDLLDRGAGGHAAGAAIGLVACLSVTALLLRGK